MILCTILNSSQQALAFTGDQFNCRNFTISRTPSTSQWPFVDVTKPLVLPQRTWWCNSSALQQTKINLADWRWSGLSIYFWKELDAEDLGLKFHNFSEDCSTPYCFCISATACVEDLSKGFCMAPGGFCCCANQEVLYTELRRVLLGKTVFLCSILGILMTYLCGVLVLASSICWLMSQLASIMFFLLHLLIITLTFCPSEPLLMKLYLVEHDRLLIRTPACF